MKKKLTTHKIIDNAIENNFFSLFSPVSMVTISAFKKYNFLKNIKNDRKEFDDSFGLVPNTKDSEYGLCLGHTIKEHTKSQFFVYKNIFGAEQSKEMACVRDARISNIKQPILLSDNELRKHVQIVGTTGSGKTMLILGLMKQQIARGGGGVVVFGKGDNDMVQSLYGTALEYNRQNDFYLFDFINANSEALKSEKFKITNNSLNLFDAGDMLSIINLLKDVATISSKGDAWEQGADNYLDSVVRVLYILEKSELLFSLESIDAILQAEDTLEEIRDNRERINGYMLAKYCNDIRLVLKLTAILKKLYSEEGSKLNKIFYNVENTDDDVKFESKVGLNDRDRLDNSLKDMIKSQISAEVNLDELLTAIINEQDKGIDEISNASRSSQGIFYKLSISASRLKTIGTFLERYELILKNKYSDLDIIEAMKSGKIIVFNIPGQEPQEAEAISKLIIGILKLLIKKQARAQKEKDTFLVVLDEINSWVKGGKDSNVGIGDILSVIRGLGMGAIVAHQSDLNSMDGATGIEKSQVEANVATTILLQNSDASITESINKKLDKSFVYYEKESLRQNIKDDENTYTTDYEMREEDALRHDILTGLNTGQGYIIRRGHYKKMISYYANSVKYSKFSEEIIPINKTVEKSKIIDFVNSL